MPATHETWTVMPHDPLRHIDEGILTVTGNVHMPLTDLQRRMTVVRLHDRRLVVYSAIALAEPAMAQLESLGVPSFLVVPGAHHRLDAKPWKERYPSMVVIAPPSARAAVEQVVAVDATNADFGDPRVLLVPVSGTNGHELALVVRRASGTTIVVSELIGNMTDGDGFKGWLLRRMGYAGDEPRIPTWAKMKVIENADALRDQLIAWASFDSLRRVIVSHGEIIDQNPTSKLRDLAKGLAQS